MLRWLGKQPVRAPGGFYPLNEVQPGGCSLAAQPWPLAAGLFGALGGDTWDVKWENNGCARLCVVNELLRGTALQKCKSSSYLAVNY